LREKKRRNKNEQQYDGQPGRFHSLAFLLRLSERGIIRRGSREVILRG
jgi:hypothetical protein